MRKQTKTVKSQPSKQGMVILKDGEQAMMIKESTPGQLLQMAINKDLDIEKLKVLVQMQKDWQAEQNKRAFTAAFSDFQRNCPILEKVKENSYVNKNNQEVRYRSPDIANLDEMTKRPLAEAGLTKDWEISQTDAYIEVTCVVTHTNGHQKRVPLRAPKDSSGGKNDIQAIGSTLSYLQRYTLMAALGLTARGMDDDGQAHGRENVTEDRNKVVMNDKMFHYYNEQLRKSETTIDKIKEEIKDHAVITESQEKAFLITVKNSQQTIPV